MKTATKEVTCALCYSGVYNEMGTCKNCGDQKNDRKCDDCGLVPTEGACFYCKMD